MNGILLTIAIGIMSVVFGIVLNAVIKETIKEKQEPKNRIGVL